MRSIHFSIARLMAMVLALALAFAALRTASDTSMGVTLLVTRAILGIAIVGAICRNGAERAFWLGFAVCGLVYVRCSLEPYPAWPSLPSHRILEVLGRVMRVPSDPGRTRLGPVGEISNAESLRRSFFKIGHSLWTLVFAGLGGLLARFLFGRGADQSNQSVASPRPADDKPVRWWWLQPLVLFLSALAIVAAIAILGSKLTSRMWAGLTFFVTCVLLGIALTGGLCGRGKQREAFLGAAVFGSGFLMLVFARPADDPWTVLPTFQLLEDAYPWVPIVSRELYASSDTTAAANARIRRVLGKPVKLDLIEEMPLEDFVKQIQESIVETDGEGIPIYINPIGLSEADKTMNSPIRKVELGRLPLRVSLRHFLEQLDMQYVVKEGLLEITSREMAIHQLRSSADDAYQVAGHCVLAMIAAALGGLASPVCCGMGRKKATG
jgi:hypothetical protein